MIRSGAFVEAGAEVNGRLLPLLDIEPEVEVDQRGQQLGRNARNEAGDARKHWNL